MFYIDLGPAIENANDFEDSEETIAPNAITETEFSF